MKRPALTGARSFRTPVSVGLTLHLVVFVRFAGKQDEITSVVSLLYVAQFDVSVVGKTGVRICRTQLSRMPSACRKDLRWAEFHQA